MAFWADTPKAAVIIAAPKINLFIQTNLCSLVIVVAKVRKKIPKAIKKNNK